MLSRRMAPGFISFLIVPDVSGQQGQGSTLEMEEEFGNLEGLNGLGSVIKVNLAIVVLIALQGG